MCRSFFLSLIFTDITLQKNNFWFVVPFHVQQGVYSKGRGDYQNTDRWDQLDVLCFYLFHSVCCGTGDRPRKGAMVVESKPDKQEIVFISNEILLLIFLNVNAKQFS